MKSTRCNASRMFCLMLTVQGLNFFPTYAVSQTLSGATIVHTDAAGNSREREFWFTGNHNEGWRMFFRKDARWIYDGKFDVKFPLTPGVHTLRFYMSDGGTCSHLGLSLFFDDKDTPSISVFAKVADSQGENPPFAIMGGNTLRMDHTVTATAKQAVFEKGTILVELVNFRVNAPSVEKINLVDARETKPDGLNDYIGTITLRVTNRVNDTVDSTTGARTRFKSLTLSGHAGAITSTMFSPDGKYIVTCGDADDSTARLWNAANGQELFTLYDRNNILATLFSPDSKSILASLGDNTARIWNVANGRPLATLKGHTGQIAAMAFSPDGKRIVTGSYDGTARVWNAASGQQLMVLKGHTSAVISVAFSNDGKRVVTGGYDKVAKVWDVQVKGK